MTSEPTGEFGDHLITLSGRFDLKTFRQFRQSYEPVLDDDTVRRVVLDFGAVDYIDSSALGMLQLLRENAQRRGKAVVIANCHGTVRDVLVTVNFHRLFDLI